MAQEEEAVMSTQNGTKPTGAAGTRIIDRKPNRFQMRSIVLNINSRRSRRSRASELNSRGENESITSIKNLRIWVRLLGTRSLRTNEEYWGPVPHVTEETERKNSVPDALEVESGTRRRTEIGKMIIGDEPPLLRI